MRFFNSIRAKASSKGPIDGTAETSGLDSLSNQPPSLFTPNPTSTVSIEMLMKVFTCVCPHTLDDSYDTSEESMVDVGCTLCDLRSLRNCSLVNRQWRQAAENLLYANVRIDAVHFCGEFELGGASRKKSRSAGRRARDEGDPARQRLILFSRTVREQSRLAQRVITLRIPFTTRETCKADLARAVSNLHQLRYVDLPEAVFSSPSSNVLKIELQAACPELCSLKFTSGSDATFEMLGQGRLFPRLENITLCDLGVDANVLVLILVGLPALSTLHVSGLPQLNDRALSAGVHLPALHMLELSHMPHLTVDGMAAYVSRPEVGKMLKRLILSDTAISVADIYKILNLSENLETLHITQTVSRPLPFQLPPLVSSSLKRLHFAISTASKQSHNMTSPSESYYTYLRNSVLDGHLPSLIHLYALSTGLPSMLQQQSRHFRPSHPFFLYTKSVAELEWDLTVIDPAAVTSTKSETRPLSLYNPPAPSTFGNQTSLMTDDGFGAPEA